MLDMIEPSRNNLGHLRRHYLFICKAKYKVVAFVLATITMIVVLVDHECATRLLVSIIMALLHLCQIILDAMYYLFGIPYRHINDLLMTIFTI